MSLRDYVVALRPQQWYKNVLIFAPLFFSQSFLNVSMLTVCIYGFLLLSLASSAGYVLNDIIDIKRDRSHPQKKFRPIASGAISIFGASIFCAMLFIVSLGIGYMLDVGFFVLASILCIITLVYSLWLKHIVFADIVCISTNFLLRALCGVTLIHKPLSPWFLLGVMSLAFFLVAGKRYGDLLQLKPSSRAYKPVLAQYNPLVLNGVLTTFLSVLILVFGLYVFSTGKLSILVLYPLLIYILFTYYRLILSGDSAVRDPERILFNLPFVLSVALFVLLFAIILYFDVGSVFSWLLQ